MLTLVLQFTKLSVIVYLLYIQCLNKVTPKVFDILYDLLRESLYNGKECCLNHSSMHKIIGDLGFHTRKLMPA